MKKNFKIFIIICLIIVSNKLLGQSRLTINNFETQTTSMWPQLKILLTTILGIGGGLFCLIGGINFFGGINPERGKQLLLAGLTAIILLAIFTAL